MSEWKVLVRTKADALDDAAPNAVLPPETEVFHPGEMLARPSGNWPVFGANVVLHFAVPLGNTCDVAVWKRDETLRESGLLAWGNAGTLVGVTHAREFYVDDASAADLYFQIINVTAGNPISMRAAPRL